MGVWVIINPGGLCFTQELLDREDEKKQIPGFASRVISKTGPVLAFDLYLGMM